MSNPLIPNLEPENISNFVWKQRLGKINWKKITTLDIDAAFQAGNIDNLQEIIENLTFAALDREDLEKIGDSSVLKVFRLSQLAMEYHLYTQNQLSIKANSCESQYKLYFEQNQYLQESFTANEKEINNLKAELQKKKHAVMAYKRLLKQPLASIMMRKEAAQAAAAKCELCSKQFVSQEYLDKHKARRHAQENSQSNVTQNQQAQLNIVPIMNTLNSFMAQQLQTLADTNLRGIKVMQDLYESRIYEMNSFQSMIIRESQQRSLYMSQEEQVSRECIEKQILIEEQKKKIEENERKINEMKENKEIINKKKIDLENILEEVQVEEQKIDFSPESQPIIIKVPKSSRSPRNLKNNSSPSSKRNTQSPFKFGSNAHDLEDDSASEDEKSQENISSLKVNKTIEEISIQKTKKKEEISAEIAASKENIETQVDFPSIKLINLEAQRKKTNIANRIRPLMQRQTHLAFHEKYTSPIETFYNYDYEYLTEIRQKIVSALENQFLRFSEEEIHNRLRKDPIYSAKRIEIINRINKMCEEIKQNSISSKQKKSNELESPPLPQIRKSLSENKAQNNSEKLQIPELKPQVSESRWNKPEPNIKIFNLNVNNEKFQEDEEEKKTYKISGRIDDSIAQKESRLIQGVEHVQNKESIKDPVASEKGSNNFREGTIFGERNLGKNSVMGLETQKIKKQMLIIGAKAVLKLLNRDIKKHDVELQEIF
ncbi:unnamed protein product [Blepharisma stoltei]|uniref:C2H2-type domain-containing protein n=1 Tax=Blepharisma stoltei TaxID=1481888 RepID=A0AAU9JN48_9CILI|nr:unnamed protein product [Blepharisma stoltei]